MTNETVSPPHCTRMWYSLDSCSWESILRKKPYFARVAEQQQLHGKGTISEVSSDRKLRVSLE